MVECNQLNIKLIDTQLKRLTTAAKNKTETNLRMSLKMIDGDNLPRELFLTTRQRTKLRNTFQNKTSTDVKLSKAQISKRIQSGWFFGSLLCKFAGPLMKVAIPLAKNNIAPLGITAAASTIDAEIQKKKTWFRNNNSNNFKRWNESHNKNCSSSWRFDYSVKRSYLNN